VAYVADNSQVHRYARSIPTRSTTATQVEVEVDLLSRRLCGHLIQGMLKGYLRLGVQGVGALKLG